MDTFVLLVISIFGPVIGHYLIQILDGNDVSNDNRSEGDSDGADRDNSGNANSGKDN